MHAAGTELRTPPRGLGAVQRDIRVAQRFSPGAGSSFVTDGHCDRLVQTATEMRHALTDQGVASDLRTAAALMLLYDLTSSRLKQLRRNEVQERLDGV